VQLLPPGLVSAETKRCGRGTSCDGGSKQIASSKPPEEISAREQGSILGGQVGRQGTAFSREALPLHIVHRNWSGHGAGLDLQMHYRESGWRWRSWAALAPDKI
jgi:hypothetical protein